MFFFNITYKNICQAKPYGNCILTVASHERPGIG